MIRWLLDCAAETFLWRNRLVVFLTLAISGFAIDNVTKSFIFRNFYNPTATTQQATWLVDGVFGIQTTTNPGALFGIGPGRGMLFSVLSIVALSAIVLWLFVKGAARDRFLNTCLGMISGGILGNLYDRLGLGFRPEYPPEVRNNVRDWILFQWKGIPLFEPWPNFNIADSLLVCGAILLVIHALFFSHHTSPNSKEPIAPQAADPLTTNH